MRKEWVDFIELEHEFVHFEDNEAFSLRTDRPLVFVQKICIAILKKLGAYRNYTKTRIIRHKIDPPNILHKLLEQKESLLDSLPKQMLIGAEDFQELTRNEEVAKAPFKFFVVYGNKKVFYDLEVIVVPSMRGLIVLPRYIKVTLNA